MDTDMLFGKMVDAGRGLAGNVWSAMETVAIPELKKIAFQIADLAKPDSPWSPEESKILLRMQVRSAVGIIVAMTALTMLAVQNAINAILDAVRQFVNSAIPFPLL
jgi:hypothetical protein